MLLSCNLSNTDLVFQMQIECMSNRLTNVNNFKSRLTIKQQSLSAKMLSVNKLAFVELIVIPKIPCSNVTGLNNKKPENVHPFFKILDKTRKSYSKYCKAVFCLNQTVKWI